MIDSPRLGGEKEVLPGSVMCPQPSAGVCMSVTSFDLGLPASAVQARANLVRVRGVRAEQNGVGEDKGRCPRGTGAPRFTLWDLNKCRTPLTFMHLLFKIRSRSLESLPAWGCCT